MQSISIATKIQNPMNGVDQSCSLLKIRLESSSSSTVLHPCSDVFSGINLQFGEFSSIFSLFYNLYWAPPRYTLFDSNGYLTVVLEYLTVLPRVIAIVLSHRIFLFQFTYPVYSYLEYMYRLFEYGCRLILILCKLVSKCICLAFSNYVTCWYQIVFVQ